MLFVAGGCALVIGVLDAYQAVTGNRVSRRPSSRSDREMRIQSAVAAVALIGIGLLALRIGLTR